MSSDKTEDNSIIFSKGSELDILAKNLVELAFDENDSTRLTLQQSIVSLGMREPKLLLSLIISFLKKSIKNKKIPTGHRIILLNCLKEILKNKDNQLLEMKDFVSEIIKHLIEEMTSSKEIQPEWQTAASNVLVTLSTNYCSLEMKFLLDKLQPSVLPHFFIIHTLGAMASNNPYGMVVYLTSIITQVLTMLSLAKTDNFRWVIANSMSHFSEAILEYVANPDRGSEKSVSTSSFSNYIFSAFEVFFLSWLNTKDAKLRTAVLDAIGNMVFIIERNHFEAQMGKLLSGIISQYKKHPDAYNVTKALSQILQAATGSYSSPGSQTPSNPDSPTNAEMPLIIECISLNNEMENIVSVLFNQLQQSLDITLSMSLSAAQQINAVKNQNEVKRCFTTICMAYPQNIIASCFQRLEGPEKLKISSLIVLKHVISSCDYHLHDKHSHIISGLRNLINDHGNNSGNNSQTVCSNSVKMHLAHVIIAMGGKGYLSEPGGLNMIEFIVRHCAELKSENKSRKLKFSMSDSNNSQGTTNAQLRSLCENVLHLSSSTVMPMRRVLWPYLIELILPIQYTEAVGTICGAIYNLFSTEVKSSINSENNNDSSNDQSLEKDDIDCIIDYDVQVNIQPPQFLLARLIVLTGVPLQNNGRGIQILKALQILIYNFHENLPSVWNLVIPKLISYLDEFINPDCDNLSEPNDQIFDKIKWEELLLRLIAKSIEHINDEEWTVEFGEALGQQIVLYEKLPEEKGFLFKCLGSIMANSNKKTFINKHLDLIFHSTRHMDTEERMGFAVGFGLCAEVHLDMVLTKLELYNSTDAKRGTGLLGFIKDNVDKEIIRASILLAYGNALFHGPRELVPSRLESYVIKTLQPCLKLNKDQLINRLIIETIDLIALAVNIEKLCQNYRFEIRSDLINCLLHFIEAEPSSNINSDIRALAIRTIGNLIILHPVVTNIEMQHVLSSCIDNIFNLPPDGLPLKKLKDMPFEEGQGLTVLMKRTMESLNNFCQIILKTFFSNVTFNEMYSVIRHKLTSEHDHIRERVLSTLHLMLSSYYKELNDVSNNGTQLGCIGTLFGDITPRLADPSINNRLLALDCVIMILKIQMKLELGRDPSTDKLIISLTNAKERLKKLDNNILFAAINDIAKIICKMLNTDMVNDLLASLYTGLKDGQKNGASAVCVMLLVLFTIRSSGLGDRIGSVLTTIHDILPDLVDNPRTGVLKAIKLLSANYLIESLNTAIAQSLPLDEVWKEILITIGNDEISLDKSLVHLTEIMNRTMPFEEREDPSSRKIKGQPIKMVRYPCHTWLAAMNCLQILCADSIECGFVCLSRMYSKLFTCILVACVTSIVCLPFTGKSQEKKSGTEANLAIGVRPISICSIGLKNFLVTTKSHEIIDEINVLSGWDKLEKEEEYMSFMSLISKSVCVNKFPEVGCIVTNLAQYSNSNYEQYRILVTGFYGSIFSSIIKVKNSQVIAETSCCNVDGLIDSVLTLLLSKLGDKSIEVRRLSLIGIGKVGKCSDLIIQKHATSLLSALLMGMDDRHDSEDKLINAAMDGLASLVVNLMEKDVRDVLVTICLRMLSCYERESSNVRASAFHLFGSLAKLATGPSYTRYLSEIDSVIVPLLVHLEDSSNDVIKACKFTLKQIMPLYSNVSISEQEFLISNKLNDLTQNCLKEDSTLHFGDFCNDFAKTLVVQMPQKANDIIMRCLVYFKSEYPELSASAVLIIGFIMQNLEEEQKSNLQRGQICVELIQLLKSKDAKVRARTADAISLLHMY